MSSKRAVRRKKCGRKVRHASLPAALKHAFWLRTVKGATHLQAYRCRWCGAFHIGHNVRAIA